jgi:hydroxypyruvate reductase
MFSAQEALQMDAINIAQEAIHEMLPDAAVQRAIAGKRFERPVTLFAIGKAAWRMAKAAHDALGADAIRQGVVITKYGHGQGDIGALEIHEAGHPIPDENGVAATRRALDMAHALTGEDEALFLLSGGGSALFECPQAGVSLADIADITGQLLASGADIKEINAIRKRLSNVKGGRFARAIAPAPVFCIALSDVLGDAPEVIASGPVHPDTGTAEDAQRIIDTYGLRLTEGMRAALLRESPQTLQQVETVMAGNVTLLCEAAARAAERLGYRAVVMDTQLACEAREAGAMIARHAQEAHAPCALIWGGETVVHVRGHGKGGRNQEVALAAAQGLRGHANACVLAIGSDGTDGPTDAAGGIVTGDFFDAAGEAAIRKHLADNDAYSLLQQHGALLITGPTGTNVNDLYMLLVK